MRSSEAVILSNRRIALDTWEMVLRTEIAREVQCGQFVEVLVPGFFLRRPISVHRTEADTISLIYKVVGDGTEAMTRMREGEKADLFGPLGNGFPLLKRNITVIGGGVGVPPLVAVSEKYREEGYEVTAVLGFNDGASVFAKEEFETLGCRTLIATMDGSLGVHGTVIDALEAAGLEPETVLACGPLPMLKAVAERYSGYISLEARMACGIGACMGCVVKAADGGTLRVCSDGPVFEIGKVVL